MCIRDRNYIAPKFVIIIFLSLVCTGKNTSALLLISSLIMYFMFYYLCQMSNFFVFQLSWKRGQRLLYFWLFKKVTLDNHSDLIHSHLLQWSSHFIATSKATNFYMTADLVLRMTTVGDKSESESWTAWKRFESGIVLAASFWRSGND